MARLSYGTHVRHPDTGAMVFLPAGSQPPSWAEHQLGVHLFESAVAPAAPDPAPAPEPPRSAPRPDPGLDPAPALSAPAPEPADTTETGANVTAAVLASHVPDPPPRHGRGSGAAAWRTWAAAAGVEVDDDATRDEVIDAAITAGVLADD